MRSHLWDRARIRRPSEQLRQQRARRHYNGHVMLEAVVLFVVEVHHDYFAMDMKIVSLCRALSDLNFRAAACS